MSREAKLEAKLEELRAAKDEERLRAAKDVEEFMARTDLLENSVRAISPTASLDRGTPMDGHS